MNLVHQVLLRFLSYCSSLPHFSAVILFSPLFPLSRSTVGQSQKLVSSDLLTEVRDLRMAALKLHLKHKSLAGELQRHRDTDAKNKADLKRLKGISICFSSIVHTPIGCFHCILLSGLARLPSMLRYLCNLY